MKSSVGVQRPTLYPQIYLYTNPMIIHRHSHISSILTIHGVIPGHEGVASLILTEGTQALQWRSTIRSPSN